MNRRKRGTIATAVPGMLNPHSWPWEPSTGRRYGHGPPQLESGRRVIGRSIRGGNPANAISYAKSRLADAHHLP